MKFHGHNVRRPVRPSLNRRGRGVLDWLTLILAAIGALVGILVWIAFAICVSAAPFVLVLLAAHWLGAF